jgi:hypothetical protein
MTFVTRSWVGATLLGACEVRSPEDINDAYTDVLRSVQEGIDAPDLEAAQVAGRQLTTTRSPHWPPGPSTTNVAGTGPDDHPVKMA